jgi:predicted amidophosphoribosyltransferase
LPLDHICQVCSVPINFYRDGDCCRDCWAEMDDDLVCLDD